MDQECPICTESLESRISTTPCGHLFHSKCIATWLQNGSDCPQCRKICNSGQIINIYINSNGSRAKEKIMKLENELKFKNEEIKSLRAGKSIF